jgi:hypothetical protein
VAEMNNNNKNMMERMLNQASRKLGVTPDELKGLLNKGDMNAIMAKMDSKDAKKLKDALADPEMMKNLKDSPEMAEYMKSSNSKK